MSDFKFPCPSCGQSIACDISNTGMQVACPACQKTLTVPSAPASVLAQVPHVLSIAGSQARSHAASEARAHAAPPSSTQWAPGGTSSPAAVHSTPRTSALAIASLACSLSSLLIGVGCIPGIICGHMAKAKMQRDSSLKGLALAKAGLALGYVFLVLGIGLTAVWIIGFNTILKQFQANASATNSAPSAISSVEAKPTNTLWTLDLSSVQIPHQPATGKIHGADFTVDSVTCEDGRVTLVQGAAAPADRGVLIFLIMKSGETLEGRAFHVSSTNTSRSPQIQMFWKDAGQTTPKLEKYTNGYAMKLEFGTAINGKLPGKIYLCLPDESKSCIGGTFEAVSKSKGTQPPFRKTG
ncbi:MAG: hypothetical protein JWR69_3882 [Pedosphaera sp.]|nr:hypothetical protein [Pedosphaera sp.]